MEFEFLEMYVTLRLNYLHSIKDWARRGVNIQARFLAWRSNVMAIEISALERARPAVLRETSLKK